MTWKQRMRAKWPYVMMYAFYVIAGALTFIYPTQAILDALQSAFIYLWSIFIFGGSSLSLYGSLRDRFSGEVIGLPLLSAGNAIFGTALVGYGKTSAAVAVGLIFWGIACGMIGRWIEMRALVRIAREVQDGDS